MGGRKITNRQAVVQVPMKLLVVMVAVAFIVPAVYHGLSVQSKTQTRNDINDGLNELITAIRFVYSQGTLETQEVTLDFSESRFSSIEMIKIGDKIGEHPGVNQSIISYKLGGKQWQHLVVTDPNIPITSPWNTNLTLEGHGRYELVVQKNTIGFTDFVVVRKKTDEGEVKMPDLYVGSISVTPNPESASFLLSDAEWEQYKPEMMTPHVPPGYTVSAVIKNIGNMAADDPKSAWNDGHGKDDGKVRVRFIDYIVERNETRDIGRTIEFENGLGPDESIEISATEPWRIIDYLYHDDAFDRTLLNRKIIAEVDFLYKNRTTGQIYEETTNITVIDLAAQTFSNSTETIAGDNIDEISGENNNRAYVHIEIPPVINSVTPQYDDPEPGIGTFITGIETNNQFVINATDENGYVWQTLMWYNDDVFSLDPNERDIPPTRILMDKNGDLFITYVDMGGINGTSNLTITAIDNSGVGSDPYETTVYMEYPPRWMENTDEGTRAKRKESGKKEESFTPNGSGDSTGGDGNSASQLSYFTLKLEVPQTLNDGKNGDTPDDVPYIEGQNNEQSEKYDLELKIPIGGEMTFSKEKTLKSKVMGMDVVGRAYMDATIHVGFSDTAVDMGRLFDLLKRGRTLMAGWGEYGQAVKERIGIEQWNDLKENWGKITAPADADEFLGSLTDFKEILTGAYGTGNEFEELIDAVDDIYLIIDDYRPIFSQLKDVWMTVTGLADDPASLLDLITFEATVGADVTVSKDWNIFSATYPIFPPVVTATIDVDAGFSATASTSATIDASLSGIDFGGVSAGFSTTLGLTLRSAVNVGVDFGIAGGGITGWVQGTPSLTLNTGFTYETPTMGDSGNGFSPYSNGALDVILEAGLDAYIKFLGWTKTWGLWYGSYTLGHWDFDVFEGTTTPPATPFVSPDPNALVDTDGNVNFPTGPAVDSHNGTTVEVNSIDLNNDNTNPNYQIQVKVDETLLPTLTSNNKLKLEPLVLFNETGAAFIFWTETANNQDLTSTSINLTNFMKDAEIKFAIIEGTAVVRGPEAIYVQPPGYADLQPESAPLPTDRIMLTFISDTDNDFSTTDDQKTMYTIWDGTGWSAPELKNDHGSFHYDAKMVPLPDGRVLSTWTRDGDENLYTVDDQQIVYSIFNGTNWTDLQYLTSDNSSVESTSLAANGSNVLLVWLARDWEQTNYIKYSTWNTTTDVWSSIKILNITTYPVQLPLAVVNEDGLAAAVWKGNQASNSSNPMEGGIYYSTSDLEKDDWTRPRLAAITTAGFIDFRADISLLETNKAVYIYNNYTDPFNSSTMEPVRIYINFKPDLEIISVLVDGKGSITARQGDVVLINATFRNTGDLIADDFDVSFYDGSPELGGTLIQTVPVTSLARDEESNVSVNWVVEGGEHEVFAILDHSNSVPEIDGSNNRMSCLVMSPVDVSVTYKNMTLDPEDPVEGGVVTITALVKNAGYSAAENVLVEFYDGDPIENGTKFGQKIISSISLDSSAQVTSYWTASNGEHELFILLNVTDNDTSNNKAFRRISLKPDILLAGMTITKNLIYEGETAAIAATIRNRGRADSDHVFVKFATANYFIGGEFVSIGQGEETEVSFEWTAPVGSHQIYATAFPTDNINELEEGENKRSVNLAVLTSKDLTIDMILAEHDNGIVNVTVNVSNIGYGDASSVNVEIYGSYGTGNDSRLTTYNISRIEESTMKTLYYEWAAPVGTKTVYAVVDPDNHIDEKNEENNGVSKDLDFGKWAADADSNGDDGSDGAGGGTVKTIYSFSMLAVAIAVAAVVAIRIIKKRRNDDP